MTRLHVFLLAAAVAALVVYGVFAERAAGAPVPSGFQPGYFTASSARLTAGLEPTAVSAISSSRWWVLAQSSSCLTAACDQNLLTTTDGGRSFSVIAPLPIADPVSIHAADDHDLFISSTHGGLWFSPDAGKSWRVVNPPGPHGRPLFAGTVQTSAGDAYVVAWSGNLTRILRASLAALSSAHNPGAVWKPLPAPPGTTMGLMVRGEPWLVLSQPPGYGFPRVYASTDGGESFHPTGATLPAIACSFDPTGAAIWADCGTGMLVGIWRSTDGGDHFTPAGSDAYTKKAPSRPVIAGTSGAIFAALSPSTAILGLHPLYRTTSSGNRYQRVSGSPAVDDWMQFDVVRPGFALALGRFTAGGTAVHPRFEYRLYAVSGLGTRYRLVRIG